MWAKNMRTRGFTIVELLIVIVIIGILAAITIVAYNGVTTRAKLAAQVSAVANYASILNAYATTNGGYPVPSATYACLGNPSTASSCGSIVSGQNACGYGSVSVDAAFNTKLSSVASLPTVPWDLYQCATVAGQGIIYAYFGTNSIFLYFWVNGTSCPAVSGTSTYSTTTENGNSACAVSLP